MGIQYCVHSHLLFWHFTNTFHYTKFHDLLNIQINGPAKQLHVIKQWKWVSDEQEFFHANTFHTNAFLFSTNQGGLLVLLIILGHETGRYQTLNSSFRSRLCSTIPLMIHTSFCIHYSYHWRWLNNLHNWKVCPRSHNSLTYWLHTMKSMSHRA